MAQTIPPIPSKQPLPSEAKKVFSGILFDVYQWQQPQFDGSVKTFEKLRRPDTVLVIPVTAEGRIIVAEQEQPGKSSFLGFVGGRVDKGETPEQGAARELLEETGYAAERLELVGAVQPLSKIDWSVYIFVARNSRKVAEQNLDAGERITLQEIGFDELVELLAAEDFPDWQTHLNRLAVLAPYAPEKRTELRRLILG